MMHRIVKNLWIGSQRDADELVRNNPEKITAILNVRGADAYNPPGRDQAAEHLGKAYNEQEQYCSNKTRKPMTKAQTGISTIHDVCAFVAWRVLVAGVDLNHRPLGYENDRFQSNH